MVLTNISTTLLLPHHTCETNKEQESVRHGFFKTKYITQPTLTPVDVITKALNDLPQAPKGKSNQQGFDQIEALTKLNVILNNAPEPDPEPNEPTILTEP